MKEKILVSACFLGVNCIYNGSNNYNQKVIDIYATKKLFLSVLKYGVGYLRLVILPNT